MNREKVLQIRGRRPRICNVFEIHFFWPQYPGKITLEQIIQTVKGQENYGNRIFLLTFPVFSCGKMEKIFFQTRKNIFPTGTIFFPTLIFFSIFPCATLQIRTILGLRKDRK